MGKKKLELKEEIKVLKSDIYNLQKENTYLFNEVNRLVKEVDMWRSAASDKATNDAIAQAKQLYDLVAGFLGGKK
jgi:hypothetical protein